VRVIAIKALRNFWDHHSDAELPLRAWLNEVREAQWTQPADIKAQFRNASILKGRRAVFNIKGNDYRLVASVAFAAGILYVKFVGTHEEYDRIDVETVTLRKLS
jgi:mRNA interferase HigB